MQTTFEYIRTELSGLYSEEEIRCYCFMIAEKLSGFSQTQLIINKNTIFSCEQVSLIKDYIGKLKKKTPIQYILGEAQFYNMTFFVDNSTLIPRPETEELVDWIIQENKGCDRKAILDIGTGSGCIALALKKHLPNFEVTAFDISETALNMARRNAEYHSLDVKFLQKDITQQTQYDEGWDIIVSNPPYIPEKEKEIIEANVLDYEPHGALFVPNDDPLLFYRHIAVFAKQHLQHNGKLFFEIHRDFGKDCLSLLESMDFVDVVLRKDISGNDRMIKASLM